jgi:oxalate---CoA ligase
MAANSVRGLLGNGDMSRPCIGGREGTPLTYEQVQSMVDRFSEQIAFAIANRADRVALAVQNGPLAALTFLGTSQAAVCAPLNPSYTEAEFVFALNDLPATLLVTDGSAPAAIAAADRAGIRHAVVGHDACIDALDRRPCPAPKPEDLALILHTSGTTGHPKRVPLTHANLTTSAANVARSLALAPDDHCLNVMPLFHIHGLVGALLASLWAGASVSCEPGFDPFRFLARVTESGATWFTAVPSIHQAVLARAATTGPFRSRLRLVRSSSSAMPPQIMAAAEDFFGVPLIEAFGMTEASHQIASNPLPPKRRKPGSVGLPTGVDVAAFDTGGRQLPVNGDGELAVRGPSITGGYESLDPETFMLEGGWLRTGDQGHLDEDGYVYITGRLKELINRAGEKISPREVEDALLAHPGVRDAVAFAVAHPTVGEEVGAAVVLQAGDTVAASELRALVRRQLAPFKVPRTLVVVDSIPLGPTGKPMRIGMAERLGLT